MKKLNINKLCFISISILIIWFLISTFEYISQFNRNIKYAKIELEKCEKLNNDCTNIKNEITSYNLPPTPILYNEIIYNGSFSIDYLCILNVLFVAIPAVYNFYIQTKSKIYKSELQRKKYKKFIFDNYKESLKAAFILPIFLIITFLITAFITGFNFNVQNIHLNHMEYTTIYYKEYYLTMLLVTFMHSIFYINLAYITFYKSKIFSINITLTYLFYLFSQIVIVSIIQYFLSRIIKFKNAAFIFAFEDPLIMRFGTDVKIFRYMIYTSFIYIFVSGIIMYLLYKNKERYVIQNDK